MNKFFKGKYSYASIGLFAGFIASFSWSFIGIIAIIFSTIALFQTSSTLSKTKTPAIIGLVLGIINTVLFVVKLVS